MKIAYFTHSIESCWNHGNAHFLRGVLSELSALGHDVVALEPKSSWSRANLLAERGGAAALRAWREAYPELQALRYADRADAAELCADADLVLVHEWNTPVLVAALGRARKRGAAFTLLFHDTHHRAVSDPESMAEFDLSGYDGVLAFGEALAEVYRAKGWGGRAFVWHEAADVRRFRPPEQEGKRQGVVWIGNWGDGERTRELGRFLLKPVRDAHLSLDVYGVRYPEKATRVLAHYGARYQGWLPNIAAPSVFARHVATVHVPRRYYAEQLPGIPTIRVFEALACGIPLVSALWRDAEGLFTAERDFIMATRGRDVARALRELNGDAAMRSELARNGLETVRARHTCAHRARELLDIVAKLRGEPEQRRLAC